MKTRSKGDGLYSCSYTPASPLKHTLAVTWGGVSIPNSPFRVSSQSQHLVTTGGNTLTKSTSLVETEIAAVVQSDVLVKTERVSVVQSELTKTVESNCKEVSNSKKKPLIIITTYTQETYTF